MPKNQSNEQVQTRYVNTPVGWVALQANQKALISCQFANGKTKVNLIEKQNSATRGRNQAASLVLDQAETELKEYFLGRRTRFSIAIEFPEGTLFQKKSWQALRKIPYGKTWSYGEQARFVGSPKAYRAVGASNGKNPVAIFVPCHRVIGASGHLVGFAGGLNIKKWLLNHEAGLS